VDVQVNETARERGLLEYDALKTKILTNTAMIGLAGSGGLALYDTSYASSFALGALASIAYIALLAGSVEQVRERERERERERKREREREREYIHTYTYVCVCV
jgi:hypothetical protein